MIRTDAERTALIEARAKRASNKASPIKARDVIKTSSAGSVRVPISSRTTAVGGVVRVRASPVTSSSVSATASMRPGKVIGGTVRRSTDGRGKEPTSNQSSSSRPNSKPNSRNNSRPNSRPGSLKKSKKLVSPPIDKKIAWHSVDGPETLVDCVTPVESTPIRSTTATEDVLLQSNGKGSSKSHTPPSGRQKRTGHDLISPGSGKPSYHASSTTFSSKSSQSSELQERIRKYKQQVFDEVNAELQQDQSLEYSKKFNRLLINNIRLASPEDTSSSSVTDSTTPKTPSSRKTAVKSNSGANNSNGSSPSTTDPHAADTDFNSFEVSPSVAVEEQLTVDGIALAIGGIQKQKRSLSNKSSGSASSVKSALKKRTVAQVTKSANKHSRNNSGDTSPAPSIASSTSSRHSANESSSISASAIERKRRQSGGATTKRITTTRPSTPPSSRTKTPPLSHRHATASTSSSSRLTPKASPTSIASFYPTTGISRKSPITSRPVVSSSSAVTSLTPRTPKTTISTTADKAQTTSTNTTTTAARTSLSTTASSSTPTNAVAAESTSPLSIDAYSLDLSDDALLNKEDLRSQEARRIEEEKAAMELELRMQAEEKLQAEKRKQERLERITAKKAEKLAEEEAKLEERKRIVAERKKATEERQLILLEKQQEIIAKQQQEIAEKAAAAEKTKERRAAAAKAQREKIALENAKQKLEEEEAQLKMAKVRAHKLEQQKQAMVGTTTKTSPVPACLVEVSLATSPTASILQSLLNKVGNDVCVCFDIGVQATGLFPVSKGATSCHPLVGMFLQPVNSTSSTKNTLQPFSFVDQSEWLLNTTSPAFVSCLSLDAPLSSLLQLLKFNVYDVHNGDSGIDDRDRIGSANCSLAQLLADATCNASTATVSLSLPLFHDTSVRRAYKLKKGKATISIAVTVSLSTASSYFSLAQLWSIIVPACRQIVDSSSRSQKISTTPSSSSAAAAATPAAASLTAAQKENKRKTPSPPVAAAKKTTTTVSSSFFTKAAASTSKAASATDTTATTITSAALKMQAHGNSRNGMDVQKATEVTAAIAKASATTIPTTSISTATTAAATSANGVTHGAAVTNGSSAVGNAASVDKDGLSVADVERLSKGLSFLKIPSSGFTKPKVILTYFKCQDDGKWIFFYNSKKKKLSECTSFLSKSVLSLGSVSGLFLKSKWKSLGVDNAGRCFSLITKERSWDMIAQSEDDYKFIVKCIRKIQKSKP